MFFATNDKYSNCAKHMKSCTLLSRKKFRKKVLLKNIRIDLMIADLLTKCLQPKISKEHAQRIGLGCTYD